MASARVTILAGALALICGPALADHTATTHHHTTHHHHSMRHHHAKHPHHSCHGMSSGTHHHHCGTRTGGPSGGLN